MVHIHLIYVFVHINYIWRIQQRTIVSVSDRAVDHVDRPRLPQWTAEILLQWLPLTKHIRKFA